MTHLYLFRNNQLIVEEPHTQGGMQYSQGQSGDVLVSRSSSGKLHVYRWLPNDDPFTIHWRPAKVSVITPEMHAVMLLHTP